MQKIEPPDSHHLSAAIGWLGLNCADEARADLRKISAAKQSHPDVLEAYWMVCAHEKNWDNALIIAELEMKFAPSDSSGWLHRAYALRRVNGGSLLRAWDALLPAAEKFPREPIVAYNLSCYACQMKKMDDARGWFRLALSVGKKEIIKQMALEDDDLKQLWPEIKQL